jgi:hypothetical protein
MKRLLLLATLGLAVLVVFLVVAGQPTRALPEYSAQTGEPCATCHVSPSGGGLRTPRGQAWVGGGKPGSVPELSEALSLLGVNLKVNAADFVAPAGQEPPLASPLQLREDRAEPLRAWLEDYAGN